MIWIIVLVVAPIAAILFAGAFGILEQLGRGGLALDERPRRPAPTPNSPAAIAEREADIRQLVQARHDRGVARGEPALDVEAEVDRLMALDPAPSRSPSSRMRRSGRKSASSWWPATSGAPSAASPCWTSRPR